MSTSMITPFAIAPPLLELANPFPNPDELRTALSGGTRLSREIFVRLWLTEGAPYAFRHAPAIYECLRGWLSNRLSVHPKEISLVGSARFGYSLAPPPKYGTPFGDHSDLDLCVVSSPLFESLVETFRLFEDHYKKKSILPRNDREHAYWDENLKFSARNIKRGFFDGNKIPTFDRYPLAQKINNTMWVLIKKLEVTPGAPVPKRASIRIYRDWECLIDRTSLNLHIVLRKV